MSTQKDESEWFMTLALEEAEKAYNKMEVPVGAVLVDDFGQVLAKGHNLKETDQQCTRHAEIICIEAAEKNIEEWRLNGCTLYSTLEPCLMCAGAIVQSRISKVIFGAYDSKGGFLSLGYNFHEDSRLNHSFDVIGGYMQEKCSEILEQFFKELRNKS